MCMSADLTTCTRIRPRPNACLQQNIYKPNLDTTVTSCIMPTDNLPRLGLESVDSFNCAHGEGFFIFNGIPETPSFSFTASLAS